MDLFRIKITGFILVFALITSGGVGLLSSYSFPQFFPNWYFQIVAFFLILEVGLINMVMKWSEKVSSQKMVNYYMFTKLVKMIASLAFVLAYALIVRDGIKSFALTFIVFYALYLLFEIVLFSKIEKRLKEISK